jgi:hypothetical protein
MRTYFTDRLEQKTTVFFHYVTLELAQDIAAYQTASRHRRPIHPDLRETHGLFTPPDVFTVDPTPTVEPQ